MDGGQELGFLGGDAVQILPGTLENGGENQGSRSIDSAVWANGNDNRGSNKEALIDNISNSNFDQRQKLTWSASEPLSKKPKNLQSSDSPFSNQSRAIGEMFYKTQLCCNFRVGTCPYVANCNFAHSLEELRMLPPNWQKIMATQEECRVVAEPIEELQFSSIGSSGFSMHASRSYKTRHCKKFHTENGCPYGDSCTFIHDQQLNDRESVAISLAPGSGGDGGASGIKSRPLNWKTKICNKWEQTGTCPFGNKCNFAHGVGELHRYGGGLVLTKAQDFSVAPSNTSPGPLVRYSNSGVPPQRVANITQGTGRKPGEKWKGPNKISLIYGDWIEDLE